MSMPTALYNRKRGRESGKSTRHSIRRAGGGTSLMARRRVGRLLRRRPAAARGEDRISGLSDDLLLLVLGCLETRTALGTGLLSRRWAHLPLELPALDFRVGDILPPRYHRLVLLHRDVRHRIIYRPRAGDLSLIPNLRRYERRAMRALASSVESFLDAADRGGRRRISRLRLEFFATHDAGRINRLIAKAIGALGVDDLEAVARPAYGQRAAAHAFPSHGLCEVPRASRLRSLKLGGCALPPLQDYTSLSTLVLQGLAKSTPEAAYEGVFTSCPKLKVLKLISCRCDGDMVVDAPMSEIRELVVDGCEFMRVRLRALPGLESLASLGTRVQFESASFPCLRRCNLALRLGFDEESYRRYFARLLKLKLEVFFGCTLDVTSLIIRFTGPDRFIVPSTSPSTSFPSLRRLLVADVPFSWDVSWPRLLLEAAPSLEVLHIHIAPSPCAQEAEAGEEILWPEPSAFRHRRLEELVMVGFQGTERQVYLARFVVGACAALRRVAMFKNGHAPDKGHWDWEVVTQEYSWTDDEKHEVMKQIVDGFSSSVQLVFG